MLTAWKKLDEGSLPPKEAFYSKLTGGAITDEDYQHAQTVWKEFNIESMKDYHNLYNLSDALLLADVLKTLGPFPWFIMDWIRFGTSVRRVLHGILH